MPHKLAWKKCDGCTYWYLLLTGSVALEIEAGEQEEDEDGRLALGGAARGGLWVLRVSQERGKRS